jgi:hypothetical protein
MSKSSKFLSIATNSLWYAGNKQIHEDLGISLFANHIRALTENSDSKLAEAIKPITSAIWKAIVLTKD